MKNELVSIIIPIYNVEKYLDKCINSIVEQTYNNIEIILVNDNSPDNSIDICKKYEKLDNRVVLINKKHNQGVSAARNSGIEISKGEYIVFVDADDWLDKGYISYMVNMIKQNDCDFGISKNCYKYDNEVSNTTDKIEIISSEEATALLLSPIIEVGCWNKIYKRSLLINNNINFNTKQYFGEGLLFITTIAQASKKVAVSSKKMYHYRQDNSTSATKEFRIDKYKNGEKSLDIIRDSLKSKSEIVLQQLYLHYCLFYSNAIFGTMKFGNKKIYKDEIKTWKLKLKEYKNKISIRKISKKHRHHIFWMSTLPSLRVKISKIKDIIKGRRK